MLILMSTWTILENFSEEKLPDKECFWSSVKDGTTSDNGEKLEGDKRWRLFGVQQNSEWILHEKYGWLSWSLFEKRCFVISWCFLKVYWYVLKILQTRSLLLFQFPWIKLGFNVKNDWCKVRKNFRHWHTPIFWKRIKRMNFLHC